MGRRVSSAASPRAELARANKELKVYIVSRIFQRLHRPRGLPRHRRRARELQTHRGGARRERSASKRHREEAPFASRSAPPHRRCAGAGSRRGGFRAAKAASRR